MPQSVLPARQGFAGGSPEGKQSSKSQISSSGAEQTNQRLMDPKNKNKIGLINKYMSEGAVTKKKKNKPSPVHFHVHVHEFKIPNLPTCIGYFIRIYVYIYLIYGWVDGI